VPLPKAEEGGFVAEKVISPDPFKKVQASISLVGIELWNSTVGDVATDLLAG
jgi:hypothetical protein